MSQTEDISGYSHIRCHREDVAEVAVEPDVEKVPGREKDLGREKNLGREKDLGRKKDLSRKKDLGRKALPSGIHSRRGQAVEVGSQDLTPDHRVFQMVCHCNVADCLHSHSYSHCQSRQRG